MLEKLIMVCTLTPRYVYRQRNDFLNKYFTDSDNQEI